MQGQPLASSVVYKGAYKIGQAALYGPEDSEQAAVSSLHDGSIGG